ncbi:MAG TPA: M48 family metalloprotease, partial [Dehalococcoidia bacterium]|nr:M48 family metalloprotease [Dehalococcoidia bacterium]
MTQEAPERILVYDRIDANRRSTALLLAVFGVVFLPVAGYLAMYLMLWVALALGIVVAGVGLGDVLAGDEGSIIVFGVVDAAISVLILVAVAYIQFRYATALVLRLARARPLAADEGPELRRMVENLCIGAGLPQPRLYIVESPAPNAFAAGLDAEHASLAVTRGLLALLDRRELEGV